MRSKWKSINIRSTEWKKLRFVPYFELEDKFIEKYKSFTSQLMVNIETGHMRFFPMPESSLLNDFYSNSFSRSEDKPTPQSEFNQGVLEVATGVIAHIKSIDKWNVLPEKWNVFDVGCGFGGFVWAMQQKGMNAWGNELNPTWVNEANEHCRGNLFYGQFEEVQQLIGKKYDFIFISHTLEHLPDPEEMLKEAKKNLSEHGLIYVNVPNSRSFRFMTQGRRSGIDYGNFPMHVNFFTPASLEYLSKLNGLRIIQLRTRPLDEIKPIKHSEDIQRFDDEFLGGEIFALLAHADCNSFQPDNDLTRKILNSNLNIPEFYMSKRSPLSKISGRIRRIIQFRA